MSIFGLVNKEKGKPDAYYTSADEALEEWLLKDESEPCYEFRGNCRVEAPQGYVFYEENMIKEDSKEIINSEDITDTISLPRFSTEIWKTRWILDSLTSVRQEEFDALNIPEDDIIRINQDDIDFGYAESSFLRTLGIVAIAGIAGAAIVGVLVLLGF